MNRYAELRRRQQKEFNEFPLGAAFSKRQFAEMMEKWGLKETDTDKILFLGAGVYIRKSDKEKFESISDKFYQELQDAIAADKTGDGFIYELFLAELADREYEYSGDLGDTLDALGLTEEQVDNDKRLKRGLEKAIKKIERKWHG